MGIPILFDHQYAPKLTTEEFNKQPSLATINQKAIDGYECITVEDQKFLVKSYSKQVYVDQNGNNQVDPDEFLADILEKRSFYVEDPAITGPTGSCAGASKTNHYNEVTLNVSVQGNNIVTQKIAGTTTNRGSEEAPPMDFEVKITDFDSDGKYDYGFRLQDTVRVFLQI